MIPCFTSSETFTEEKNDNTVSDHKKFTQIIEIISAEWVACIAGSGVGGEGIRYFSARGKDVAAARDRSSYCLGSFYFCASY